MDVTFIQTADPLNYRQMLDSTSRTVIEHCRRKGFQYESYIGIKRGYWPWQATYNRIHQLKEILDRGYQGWVVYLDADAYVVDLDFDLAIYLAERSDRAAVLMPSMATDHRWDINAGVVLLNFGHPLGREMAWIWAEKFTKLSDQRLREAEQWLDTDSDQDMLQNLLQERPDILEAVYLQPTSLMNSSFATYIRQHLRSYTENFAERVAAIHRDVDDVMRPESSRQVRLGDHHTLVNATYRAVLDRSPDPEGLEAALRLLRDQGVEDGLASLIQDFLNSDEFRALQRERETLERMLTIAPQSRGRLFLKSAEALVPESHRGLFVDPSLPPDVRRRETLYELEHFSNAHAVGHAIEMLPFILKRLERFAERNSHLEVLYLGSRTGAGAAVLATMFGGHFSYAPAWFDAMSVDPTFREYQKARWPQLRTVLTGDILELGKKSYDVVIAENIHELTTDPHAYCDALRSIARKQVFASCPLKGDEAGDAPGMSKHEVGACGATAIEPVDSWWWRKDGRRSEMVVFSLEADTA